MAVLPDILFKRPNQMIQPLDRNIVRQNGIRQRNKDWMLGFAFHRLVQKFSPLPETFESRPGVLGFIGKIVRRPRERVNRVHVGANLPRNPPGTDGKVFVVAVGEIGTKPTRLRKRPPRPLGRSRDLGERGKRDCG